MRTRVRSFFVVLAALLVAVGVLFTALPRGALPDTRIVSVAQMERAPSTVFDFVTIPVHWPPFASIVLEGQFKKTAPFG
ncbi:MULTISPECIES: hypothetical protein [unclassified Caballeronia]|uniref:hypothetical protein n=1 Tax=unclassified Caballeronia TaxID=2646786 RepID=UPI002029A867|nr:MULTISPECIES: hypothetical protein [unclassified Caballeronia]